MIAINWMQLIVQEAWLTVFTLGTKKDLSINLISK